MSLPLLGAGRTAPGAAAVPAYGYTNVLFWHKSTDITGLNDGDLVGTWSDSSGNGNDFIAPTSGRRPTYKTNVLNSFPSVRFGTNSLLSLASAAVADGDDAFTMFFIARKTAGGGDFVNKYDRFTAGGVGYRVTFQNRYTEYTRGSSYRQIDHGSQIADNTFYILGSAKAAGNVDTDVSSFRNLSIITPTASNGVAFSADSSVPLSLGDFPESSPLTPLGGDFLEVLCYGFKMTDLEIADVIAQLNVKYELYEA